jgi:hypothetical protein
MRGVVESGLCTGQFSQTNELPHQPGQDAGYNTLQSHVKTIGKVYALQHQAMCQALLKRVKESYQKYGQELQENSNSGSSCTTEGAAFGSTEQEQDYDEASEELPAPEELLAPNHKTASATGAKRKLGHGEHLDDKVAKKHCQIVE